MTTIKDIARISGYSIGTVSRVLNNKADVSDEARSRIESVIREQNYQPNSNAKKLKQSASSGIAVIVRGMNNIFLDSVLEEIQFRMKEHGENISVHFLDEAENETDAALQISVSTRPNGIIFLGGSPLSFGRSFSEITVPCVLVTASAASLGFSNLSSFTTDDYSASGYAVSKLIGCGHRRIGIIGGRLAPGSEDGISGRINGAVAAITGAGLPFDAGICYEPCSFSMQAGYDAAGTLLDRFPDMTGLFAVSDTLALGAIRAFSDRGLSAPEDISVIGFDGIDFSGFSSPRLTTVKQDIAELASRSVDDLLLRINYGRPAAHTVIPFSFIEGESISSPRSA